MIKKFLGMTVAAVALATSPVGAKAENIRLAFSADFESMEPYTLFQSSSIFFLSNIYEALVRFDANSEIEPSLATEWEVVRPDLYRFHLREDVKFHDGADFTADDVVFSFERAMSEGSLMGWATHSIEEVRKVDTHTVEIELKHPNNAFLNEISNLYIMSKQWAEENNALRPVDHRKDEEGATTRAAIGTGPFILERREQGVVTIVRRNDDWWDDAWHDVARAEIRPISSDATRVAALLSGEMDFIESVPLQDMARLDAAPSVTLVKAPSVRSVFVGLNQVSDELSSSDVKGKNPVSDPRVRKAMYQAIDVDGIRDKVMLGAATPAATLIAPGITGHDGSIGRHPYDPDASRELMAEAGYADGFRVTMDCPVDSEAVNDEEICQALVPMLARIGITVDLVTMTQSRYQDKVLSGNSDMYLLNIGSANVKHGSSVVNLALRTPEAGTRNGWFNPGGYSNARIDEIALQLNAETDPDELQALFSEVMQISHDEIAVLPLHQQNVVWAMKPNIDVAPTPDNFLRLWHIKAN